MSGISDKCLSSIKQVESGGKNPGCVQDGGSLSCGKYQIKEAYWKDCGTPGSGWKDCAQNDACAAQCVRDYTSRYEGNCTGGQRAGTCEDYSRLHNGGPRGCQKSSTDGYWNRVNSN